MKYTSSFTLIELLIVIGILAILTAAVVIVLNPTELLKQGRDSTRMTDLASLSKTIQLLLTQNPSLSLGTASTVYISLPDTSSTCTNLSLPTLPAGYTYHCVPTASSTLLNSSGWLPIDFTSSIQSLPRLPIDPTNTSSTGLYYTYTPNPATQTYELTSIVESIKYRLGGSADTVSTDGGLYTGLLEKGTNLALLPLDYGDTSLVGYWTFDEGGGTTVYDRSGYGRNLTMYSSSTVSSLFSISGCQRGACIQLDGLDDYLDIQDFSLTNDYTIVSYIRPDSFTAGFMGGTGTGARNLRLYSSMVNTANANLNFSPALIAGNNYFLVFVRENSSDGKIYVDGTLVGSTSSFDTSIFSIVNIGAYKTSNYYDGILDEIKLYNRALSAAEILSLYNATR